ncbi:MAG: DUF349 domain-containing protein [Bacteroidia bacterium]
MSVTKDELIRQLEELARQEMTEEVTQKADELKNEYLRLSEHRNQELLEQFIAEGGVADDFEPRKDPDDGRFAELMHILQDRLEKAKKLKADEVQTQLKAKEAIVAELEKLVNEETNIGKAFNTFRELQNRWKEIGNLSHRDYRNIQSAYHRHVHNFYYNMKLSKDLRDLDFKRNHEHRTQLLTKIESLGQMESVKGVERLLNLYRMEWSELGPTAPETVEPLRTRYRELIGGVLQRIRDFYQSRQKEEQAHLETKKALLERAKGIAAETFDNPKAWQTMTETLNGIFEDWKKAGFGPKAENEKIWNEFRKELNTFYTKKREFFGELKKSHKAGREKKQELIKKAEAIAASTHETWEEPTKQVIALQQEWKASGPVEGWEENKLWKKFREACDKFFEAKRGHFGQRDAEQLANLQKKKDLIAKIEAFTPTGNTNEDLKVLRDFSAEWKTIEHVPFKEKEKIWDRYKKAIDAKYASMKLEAGEAHLARYRSSVELLAQSDEAGNLLRREKNNIREKIGKLQATINQYENNLGFFRNSKNMGGLLDEVENNLKRAREEMELLQKKLKAFSEVQPPAENQ